MTSYRDPGSRDSEASTRTPSTNSCRHIFPANATHTRYYGRCSACCVGRTVSTMTGWPRPKRIKAPGYLCQGLREGFQGCTLHTYCVVWLNASAARPGQRGDSGTPLHKTATRSHIGVRQIKKTEPSWLPAVPKSVVYGFSKKGCAMNAKRVIISGGSGFIGTNVLGCFCQKDTKFLISMVKEN